MNRLNSKMKLEERIQKLKTEIIETTQSEQQRKRNWGGKKNVQNFRDLWDQTKINETF